MTVKVTQTKNLERYGIFENYKEATFDNQEKKGISQQTKAQYLQIKAYADNLGENMKQGIGLFLRGGVGTGKTTLAVCVMRKALDMGIEARLVNMASLADSLLSLKDPIERKVFETMLRETKVIVFDDVGAESRHEWVINFFNGVLAERNSRNLVTILTSNLTVDELKAMYPIRTLDRIREKCASIVFQGTSLRKTAKIIYKGSK